jgi:hypothetical protein
MDNSYLSHSDNELIRRPTAPKAAGARRKQQAGARTAVVQRRRSDACARESSAA